MLVLTRKPQEVIQIGPNVTITIVRVSGNSVRIGIDAPLDVRVTRGELTADDPKARDNSRFETANANRLPRSGNMLARVKSLTVVESPAESTGSNSGVADSRLRNQRVTRDEISLGF